MGNKPLRRRHWPLHDLLFPIVSSFIHDQPRVGDLDFNGWITLTTPIVGEEPSASSVRPPPPHLNRPRTTDDEEELARWIEELGSTSYRVREKAAVRLARCDSSVVVGLRQAAEATMTRSPITVSGHRGKNLRFDLGKRLQAFLRESDPEKTHGFESWERFSEIAGTSRQSKRLYVDLLTAYPDLDKISPNDATQFMSQVQKEALSILAKFPQGQCEITDVALMMFRTVKPKATFQSTRNERRAC